MKSAKIGMALAVLLGLFGILGAGSAFAGDAAEFGIANFSNTYHDPSGDPLLQAGGHADVSTDLDFKEGSDGLMNGTLRDVEVDLPAGFSGNPQAMATCTMEDLVDRDGLCDPAAQVGVLRFESGGIIDYPVYNLKSPDEQTAVLAVVALGVPAKIVISARTDGDYGLIAKLSNLNQGLTLVHTTLILWGVPYDEVHDALRYGSTIYDLGVHVDAPLKPFLSLPSRCEPMLTVLHADSWQNPGSYNPDGTANLSDPRWVSASSETPPLTGCEDLDFSPSLDARPTTNVADSPSGLDLDLNLPQNADDPDGLSPANLRTVAVDLPEGLVVNPSGANGLGACNLSQIGYLGKSNERQLLRVPSPLSGTFSVSFGGQSTPPLIAVAGPAAASQTEVTKALEALPGLAGNISVQRAPGGWIVTFINALAGTDVPSLEGSANDQASGSLEVTGSGGGFNLQAGADSTELKFKVTEWFGDSGFAYTAGRDLKVGETIEGPGIPAGTKVKAVYSGIGAEISKPSTEMVTGVELNTVLPFDASAAAIQGALQGLPAIGAGKVLVSYNGKAGLTRSYQLVFLTGSTPAITSTNSLTGAGAGVAFTAAPSAPHDLEVLTLTNAGTPRFDKSPANCPDNSKIGSVEVDTPAFPDPLKGSLYTMTPYENPFGSLLGIYIVVEGRGLVVKLPASVQADPKTGRLTNAVSESPQLPIENVRLRVDGGAAAVLRTPAACGKYATNSTLTPWSAPVTPTVKDKDEWAIAQAPAGGSCAAAESARPNTPTFQAGSQSGIAGAYSPFVLKLARNDGTQQLTGIDTVLPQGLLAKLAGTTYCSDAALAAAASKDGKAEQASPSCPATSRVGSVTVGAGAGPKPFYAPATAYLAGPYKGAPLSLAVVAPAVAGPFDLGTVVVRNALYVDPTTAQVHAVSDRFPTILQGIPLDIRSVDLRLDRPEFTKNPTSCDPFAITGFASTLAGQQAALENRFQVGECGRLKFKPKLNISLKGKTKRTGNPALTAVLKMPAANQANIAKTTVVLPQSMFIDNSHIANPCTRVQFDADQCPKGSILGKATAFSPLLDEPLRGKVYFRSNGGDRELPDLVADLDGQIHVTLVGFIDSVKTGPETARVRTRFVNVPDAPVSKFVLKLFGGKRGLIENSVNLCKAKVGPASVQMEAQNADTAFFDQPLGTSCGKKSKKRR